MTLPSAYEDRQPIKDLVERLMGRDPAERFRFIQNGAAAVDEETIDVRRVVSAIVESGSSRSKARVQ